LNGGKDTPEKFPSGFIILGFDHGAGHSLLLLDDAKAPNCQKNNGFKDLGNYSGKDSITPSFPSENTGLSKKADIP
jgi:hypothetical protein